ncbi:MAG: hypothetical protein MZU79_07425 [Anaerotruncus sp.]|nr:hypothetical protein [Anaerotruncus sp.]
MHLPSPLNSPSSPRRAFALAAGPGRAQAKKAAAPAAAKAEAFDYAAVGQEASRPATSARPTWAAGRSTSPSPRATSRSIYAAVGPSGLWKIRGRRPQLGARPSTRKRRSRSARSPSRRATPISSGSARARPRPATPWPPATASTSPRTPAGPGRTWAWPRPASSAASSSIRPIPTSSTSPPRATSGARTRSAASTGRPTAARPGRRSSTSTPRPGACDLAIDPSNSKILYAGMWEHRRWPYYFRSGGPGSGIYRTTDGGETWTAATDGLPAGALRPHRPGRRPLEPERRLRPGRGRGRAAASSAPRTRAAPGAGPATRPPTTRSTSGRSTTAG